jgi:hypothetical protein
MAIDHSHRVLETMYLLKLDPIVREGPADDAPAP